jgi:hypothetical protein
MCHAMNVFQMGIILILHLVGNTIGHPLENIHAFSPKRHEFCKIYIKKTPSFFKTPIITLVRYLRPSFCNFLKRNEYR